MSHQSPTLALMANTMEALMGNPRPCIHCQWWGGSAYGAYSFCDKPRAARGQARTEIGCAHWTREPGSDDEPGSARTLVNLRPLLWRREGDISNFRG